MRRSYQVNKEQRLQYAGLFLLDRLSGEEEDFFVDLPQDQQILLSVFSWLQKQRYVQTDHEHKYGLTVNGSDILERFRKQYRKFLKESDIFCAIDLSAGEFAYSYYRDFNDQKSWEDFLNQERWEDLRVAVAEHEGEDIIEIIFMDMINEGYYGKDEQGVWSFDKLLGSVWSEIEEIATNSIHTKDLAYEAEGALIPGSDVIEDIIHQGRNIARQIQDTPLKKD